MHLAFASSASARKAIESQFPTLAPAHLVWAGAGQDHDVWRVNDTWMFRFPRRRDVADRLPAEIAATRLAAERLAGSGLAVPVFEHRGRPGPHFPYPFVGYRALPGVAADAVPEALLDRPAGARALGAAFAALHGTPPERTRGMRLERDGAPEWARDLARHQDEIRPLLPEPLAHACRPWLDGEAPLPPPFPGPPCFIHDDVCPDHLLVDPATGRLTALLDFGDAALGDPALDFVGLRHWLGRDGVAQVLAHYPLERAPGFAERVEFATRVATLLWLRDAALEDGDVEKHRRWVACAFDAD